MLAVQKHHFIIIYQREETYEMLTFLNKLLRQKKNCPLLIKPTNHMKTQCNSNHKYIIVSLIKLSNCVICVEHEE